VARLDAEGSLYYHAIFLMVGLILFVALKNFNFADYRDSPFLTLDQVQVLQILYVILVIWIAIISFRGFVIKTPEYATRGMLALVSVSLGLFIILFNFMWDPINNQDVDIGGLGSLSISLSGILIAMGMVVYIHIKFTEDRQQEWFIKAVKDTIERIEVSEYKPASRRAGRRGRKARKREASASEKMDFEEPKGQPETTPMPQPTTTPVQSTPSMPSGAQTVPMLPPKIFKCPSCTKALKVPDVAQRPISIRCPHCGSIAKIFD
jgi:hypothetical protein